MRSIKKITLFIFAILLAQACDPDGSMSSDSDSVGQGGSMTRFAIQGNRMYVVNRTSLLTYNITDDHFQLIGQQNVGFRIETIFAKGEYLYLGAGDGMYIYSVINPDEPDFIFKYSHVVSCDPVVVQGNRAYVTLSRGSGCNFGNNALEIIDITDPYQPTLLANYPLTNPRGLSIDGNLLFICEAEYGWKIFDITNELNVKLVGDYSNIDAFDIIARAGTATITGKDGIFQYAYDLSGHAELIGSIPVQREEF